MDIMKKTTYTKYEAVLAENKNLEKIALTSWGHEDGDCVPQYRYSIKGHKYTTPYNGEEVKLYWANYDQYYTKTGILFSG